MLSNLALSQEVTPTPSGQESLNKLTEKINTGEIIYKLTEPDEIKEVLGEPQSQNTRQDGGMLVLEYTYSNVAILFGKFRDDKSTPFTILHLAINGKNIDIGKNKKLVLRNQSDLRKLNRNWDFQNVSLRKCDLREEIELLGAISFDNLTEWPTREKLPPGFNPDSLIENGKTPGLGVQKLHQQGITGKGVGIAIIDQPLLLGHKEYTSRLVRYDATGLADFPPQMHGSPIASIAVGQNIGVAPEAELSYFAVRMWEKNNHHYVRALNKIFDINAELPEDERIRIVSISSGMFSSYPGFDEWNQALQKAEQLGILVVTCDPQFLDYGILKLVEGKNPDDPRSYVAGKYVDEDDQIRIPAGNKTIASHRGTDVYTYDREGGMSWAAPYIAGLAALAFQVNKDLEPKRITEHLVNSATNTQAGPIVNPTEFIERVKPR